MKKWRKRLQKMIERSKAMTLKELFEKVKNELGKDSALFLIFLEEFTEKFKNRAKNPDWPEKHNLEADNIHAIWDIAVNKLFDIAWRLANDIDDPVYTQATEIASALRAVILAEFGIKLEEVEFQSPSRIMEDAGFLKISDGPEGEKQVQLTKMGQEASKTFDDLIKALKEQNAE